MSNDAKKQTAHAQAGRKLLRSQLSRRLLIQYLLALLVWAVAVAGLALLCWLVSSSFSWSGDEPLYHFISWAADNVLIVYGLTTVVGWIVISYYFLSKPLRYLDELVDAAGRLAQPDETPITLPLDMKHVEDQLNLARQQALRDARAARDAEQRKNDLVVYLAHDLKTPLTSVIGYLTLLQDEPQLSPELRARYTGIALEKAERLEDLVNEFFDITRFNLTRLELEVQPTDLTRMLEQVCSEFGPQLAEQDLRCRLELPPRLLYPCDPDKMARVFDNLLRNACHYSYPSSTVVIAAYQDAEAVHLSFTNAGKTIPQEKLNRIFEQFFRLDSSRATRTGGAGLGLAIAKEIVELHGGSIAAESAADHITFTIQLPRRETNTP